MSKAEKDVVEKLVIFVVDNAFGRQQVQKGQYKALDQLALNGQSGFVSTFTDSNDTISQLVGSHYFSPDQLSTNLGPMRLSVLKDKSQFNAFGDIVSITGKSDNEIYDTIINSLKKDSIIITELNNLKQLDEFVGKFLPLIKTDNIAICILCGYAAGAEIPSFPSPPVVDQSWKVIGPDVVDKLTIKNPMLFVSQSKQLTRIDHVKVFNEKEIADKCGMGALPICQLFREFSYYTGSTWKYGA